MLPIPSDTEAAAQRAEARRDAAADTLPTFCRFKDLRAVGIATNWPQLLRMIDLEGFPKGVWLSPNIRAWDIALVRRWLAERPTARKKIVPHKQKAEEAEA